MTFKNIRNAHGVENTEDYLELINDMLNKTGEARIVDIANKFDIAQATANKTIKRLQIQGYIEKGTISINISYSQGTKNCKQIKKTS